MLPPSVRVLHLQLEITEIKPKGACSIYFFCGYDGTVDIKDLKSLGVIRKGANPFIRIHRSVSRQSYKLCGIIRVMVHEGSSPFTPTTISGIIIRWERLRERKC